MKVVSNEVKVIRNQKKYKAETDLIQRNNLLNEIDFLKIPRKPDWKGKEKE